MGVQIGTVKTDSFSMDYCRFGHGKDTLIIIPGISVQSIMPSAEAIAEAYKLLTEDFTIYAFDRRKDFPEDYSIKGMADDTAEAIRELGLDKVDIFGASQGGMIAIQIASEYHELVNKLILGSTSAHVGDEESRLFDEWIALAKEGKSEGLYLAFGEAVYPEETLEQVRDLFIQAAGTVTEEELYRFVTMAESIKGMDITDCLDKITCPVLVIGSNDDKVLGADASRYIASRIKGCELHMYDGYGHAAYDTAPDYRQRMLSFLK